MAIFLSELPPLQRSIARGYREHRWSRSPIPRYAKRSKS